MKKNVSRGRPLSLIQGWIVENTDDAIAIRIRRQDQEPFTVRIPWRGRYETTEIHR